MKKLFIAISLSVASSVVLAAGVCTGTAGNGETVSPASTPLFVKTAFRPKCSANVHAEFLEDASAGAAGAVSTKGNQKFSGHTNGGAVTGVACAAAACASTEAAGVAASALTASSS